MIQLVQASIGITITVIVILALFSIFPSVVSSFSCPTPTSGGGSNPNFNTVIKTMIGFNHPSSIGYSPTTHDIYIGNDANGTVSILDSSDNLIKTIVAGSFPDSIAYSPDTHEIYVANFAENANDTITIINSSNIVTGTITVGSGAYGLVYSPITHEIYAEMYDDHSVYVINSFDVVTKTIPVGNGATASLSFSPITHNVYVPNQFDFTISIIGPSDTVINTLSTSSSAFISAYFPVTQSIYTTNGLDIIRINSTDNISGTIPNLISAPFAATFSPDSNELYILINTGGVVLLIDGSNNIIGTIPVGPTATGIQYSQSTHHIYVANNIDNTVSVIDTNPSGGGSSTTPIVQAWINGCNTIQTQTAIVPILLSLAVIIAVLVILAKIMT